MSRILGGKINNSLTWLASKLKTFLAVYRGLSDNFFFLKDKGQFEHFYKKHSTIPSVCVTNFIPLTKLYHILVQITTVVFNKAFIRCRQQTELSYFQINSLKLGLKWADDGTAPLCFSG